MKISSAVVFAVAAADEKKVPPRHPLQRLNKLVIHSTELLNDHVSVPMLLSYIMTHTVLYCNNNFSTVSWPQRTHGSLNSQLTLNVCAETSAETTNDVDSMTTPNYPMVS